MSYNKVSTNPGGDSNFPSSFTRDEKTSKGLLLNRLGSYNFRRKVNYIAVFAIFIFAATIATYELGKEHGNVPEAGKSNPDVRREI